MAPITTGRQKLQTIVKTYVFDNMRAVEARSPFRGRASANHDGTTEGCVFTKKTQKSGVLKKCTPSRHEAHFCEERVPGRHESRGVAENYKQL
jgi:hypothetical protein